MGSARHTRRDLCYLDADKVELPAGRLGGFEVCSQDDEKLGDLDGVLIEPTARRVRYFVIRSNGWFRTQRYLVPIDNLARVDRDRNRLRIDARAREVARKSFDRDAVRHFSDDDVVTAMFASTAA